MQEFRLITRTSPRIGFAYSVLPQTILRSGFGISYFPGNYTSNTDLKNVPFLSNFQPNCQSSVAVQIEGNVTGKPGTTGNPQCAAAYASFDQRSSVAFAGEYFEPANLNPLSFVPKPATSSPIPISTVSQDQWPRAEPQ